MQVCWFTVCFDGTYSTMTILMTSKKASITISILIFNIRAYFGLADAVVSNCMNWRFVSMAQ